VICETRFDDTFYYFGNERYRQVRKSEEKKISGEAYDVNKQTIYTAPTKSNQGRITPRSPHGAIILQNFSESFVLQ